MGKLFWQISTTLDGFMEATDGSLKRTAEETDEDFDRYAAAMLNSIDGMLLGRKTYELFVDYWPKAAGADADNMNRLPKYVFSHSLSSVDWDNAKLIGGSTVAAVEKLKAETGGDLAVFGSAELAGSLAKAGLIDEYRILSRRTCWAAAAKLLRT